MRTFDHEREYLSPYPSAVRVRCSVPAKSFIFELADGGVVCTEGIVACKSKLMGSFYLLTFHYFRRYDESSGFRDEVVTKGARSTIY